jgi:PAS domain S-box-containing protein
MGRVAQTGEPLIIDDYSTWSGRMPQYAGSELHAVLAAPLKIGGQLVGVFTLVAGDPSSRFGPADLHLVNVFAHQAAIAIQNARLYDQAQQEIADRMRAQEALRSYQEHLEKMVQERTAELRESEQSYRNLFDGVPVGLYRTTPTGKIIDANPAQAHILGYPRREDLLAISAVDLYTDLNDRVQWQELMEREGIVRDFEVLLRRYDGSVVWVNDTARGVRDEQGRVQYYDGSMEDISERKQVELELRQYQAHLEELVEARTMELQESEERFRTLFEGVPVGLYRSTPAGQLLDVNRGLVQMLGFPSREMALATADVSSHYAIPEDRARWQALMEREGVVHDFEARFRRYDGQVIWVSDTARAVKDDAGVVVRYEGSLEDITERKMFEEEIRRQKEYFEALFVNNPVAVVTADLDGKVVSWNPMAEKLFRYTPAEAIGQYLDDLVAKEKAIQEEARSFTDQVLRLERVQVATRRTRKDGSLIDVELLALPVILAGEKVGFIVIYHDISERIRAEEELRQAKDAAEAANQAKSTFLANMSHELRTPLNAILGFSHLMDGDVNLTAEQLDNLAIINESGEHLLSLINDVLEMSKIEAGRVTLQETSFDLYDLLDSLEQVVRLRAEDKGLSLSFRRAEDVARYVVADHGKLRQTLSNLLGNAVKFTQEGGVALRVTASPPRPSGEPGRRRLHFEVEDTGPGIAPDEIGILFDPFAQATSGKQSQEGTGLGLSICRQFVHLMGGDLSVRSQLGQGSCFTFDVEVDLGQPEDVVPPLVGLSQRVLCLEPDEPIRRILVAEDRESNRRLLVRSLQRLGFEVREATNGEEAIQVWEQWHPHLIWMDMRMPVIDGYEATRRIKASPGGVDTPVIALTASAFEEDQEKMLTAGCNDIVRKPFRMQEIHDMLVKHLAVCFSYEAGPPSPAVPERSNIRISPGELVLADLPPGWLAALGQATVRADLPEMLDLIDEIRPENAVLAASLRELAREFEYDRILRLLEQVGGDDVT